MTPENPCAIIIKSISTQEFFMSSPTSGRRIHFSKIVSQTPVLLYDKGSRWVFWLFHDSSADLRLGFSGSIATQGILIPSEQRVFIDDLSSDEYWAYYASGSGTVTGYVVV
jgi:hypothetical protein